MYVKESRSRSMHSIITSSLKTPILFPRTSIAQLTTCPSSRLSLALRVDGRIPPSSLPAKCLSSGLLRPWSSAALRGTCCFGSPSFPTTTPNVSSGSRERRREEEGDERKTGKGRELGDMGRGLTSGRRYRFVLLVLNHAWPLRRSSGTDIAGTAWR